MHKLMITKKDVVTRLRSLREEARIDRVDEGLVKLSVWRADDSFGIADYWSLDWAYPGERHSGPEAVGMTILGEDTRVKELGVMADELLSEVMGQLIG